jgi:hypothetical protein
MGRHDTATPNQETLDRIREEFRHDPATGELFRRVGTLAVDKYGNARLVVSVKTSRNKLVSHVIWFLEHGSWPTTMLDHRDGDSLNNRPKNLRQSTHSRNLAGARKHRRSLPIGVYAKRDRFQARINGGHGAMRTIGIFDTPEEAEQAFIAEHLRRFGSHSRYFDGKREQRFSS